MVTQNTFYRISIKALILNEYNKFLLMKEENGYWELPGGGLEFGESVEACLRRELHEEAGFSITHIADQPSYFITRHNLKNEWKANCIYETKVADLNFTPSEECTEIRFFSPDETLKETLYPTVETFVHQFKKPNS